LEESLNRLLYEKAFSPENFKATWRELMMQSLMQVFLWPVFEGEFFECRIEHDPLARIPLSKVLMEAAYSMIPLSAIQSSLPSGRSLVRTPEFEQRLRLLNLSMNESFLVSRVEGQNITLETLQLLTGFPAEQISRTVYLLQACGVLKFESSPTTRVKRASESIAPGKGALSAVAAIPVQEIRPQTKKPENPTPPLEPKSQPLPRKWIDSAPRPDKNVAERSYAKAKALYEAGKYNEAAKSCGAAIKNDSNHAAYHFLMARILTNFPHSIHAAVDSFRQAILLDSSNIEYRLRLVEFLKECGQINDAYDECRQLAEIVPEDRDIALLLRKIELER
jgi:tetratricopeptide (TPR) repeat protein